MFFQHIWGADAGDIVSAIYTHTTIHPPGYPIFNLFGQLSKLLPFGSPAQKISLTAAVFSLLTFVNLWHICWMLLAKLKINRSRLTMVASVVLTVFLLAGSYLWLIYSFTPEIFTTSIFFITLNAFYLIKHLTTNSTDAHCWFWLTFGIGFFFQYTILLNLLAYFLVNTKVRKRFFQYLVHNWRFIIAGLSIGFIPYLLLWLVWNPNAIVFWESKNFPGLLRLIFRLEYGFFATTQNSYQPFLSKFGNVYFYVQTLLNNFSFFGLFLSVLGAYYLLKLNRRVFLIIAVLWLLYGPLLAFYLDAKIDSSFSKAILERFFLLSFPFVALFICFGFIYLPKLVSRLLSFLLKNQALQRVGYWICLVVFSVVFPLLLVGKNIRFVSALSRNQYFFKHTQNLFAEVPDGSILILRHDMNLFPAQYYRYIVGIRKDLFIFPYFQMFNSNFYTLMKHQFSDLIVPASNSRRNRFLEFVRRNIRKRAIFTNVYFKHEDFKLVKHGLLFRVYPTQTRSMTDTAVLVDSRFLNQPFSSAYPIYFYKELQDIYSDYYLRIAHDYKAGGKVRLALSAAKQAYQINEHDHELNVLYGLLLIKNQQCLNSEKVLTQDFYLNRNFETALILSRLYAVCYRDPQGYLFWDEKYRNLKPSD